MGEFPDSGADASLAYIASTLAEVLRVTDATAEAKLEAIRLLLTGTIAVSASSLPLATGAATEAKQSALLTAISGTLKFEDSTAETKLEAIRTILTGTVAISASSLPLPSGAATKAQQEATITALQATLTVTDATVASRLATIVTLLEATQKVQVTNFPSTQAISATTLPLPSEAAKDGKDETGSIPPTGAEGIRGWLSAIYTVLKGTLKVNRLPDTISEGTITTASGAGSEVVTPIIQGMTMMVAWFKGTYEKATIVAEISSDGGTSWMVIFGGIVGSSAGTTQVISGSTSVQGAWEAPIPAGTTHFRARCSSITSGTVEIKLAQGSSDYETAINATPAGTSTVLGTLFSGGMWKEQTVVPLIANATFTGAVIDVTGVASATAFTNLTSNSTGEYRISATSDKEGTLYIETSRDNTTFFKVKAIKLAKADANCSFYGEIIHFPSDRYLKCSFANGAEAQTKFKIEQFTILGP